MAKKRTQQQEERSQRQSRKEILLARKQARQTRQIRLAMGVVIGLLVLVFVVAVVNELVLAPNRAVATVAGEEITFRDWERRVIYERANRILILETQLEAFGGDVGIIQQFGGSIINELLDAEGLGQDVLNQMMEELAAQQAAEARGITVSEADVDASIGESFSFYDGESPTATPTATQTAVPTPSLTPFPTAVITDIVPTSVPIPTRTLGPTLTPAPAPTPVSAESFQKQYSDFMAQLNDLGVSEETFRQVVRARLYTERLMEDLAAESDLAEEGLHVSFYLLSFDTEEEANEVAALIQDNDFVTIWNTYRSLSLDSNSDSTVAATEILWRTEEELTNAFGPEIASIAMTLPPNVPGTPIAQAVDAQTTRYHLLQVSGREVRPFTESAIENAKFRLLTNFIDQALIGDSSQTEFWRSRVPTTPILDPIFLTQPTPAPQAPPVIPAEPGN